MQLCNAFYLNVVLISVLNRNFFINSKFGVQSVIFLLFALILTSHLINY